jgi:quinol monooxygenase YgiN
MIPVEMNLVIGHVRIKPGVTILGIFSSKHSKVIIQQRAIDRKVKKMPEPIVFISRNKVKAGKIDEFRQHYRDSIPPIMASKPNTLVQLAYENEAGVEMTVVRIFPDADSLDQQIQGADQRSKKTYEFIDPVVIEIYGEPVPATIEMMKKIAGTGVVVSIHPNYIGGFIR